MDKPRITYLLGAGASYNALPIIDELAQGFKILGGMCGLIHMLMQVLSQIKWELVPIEL